MEEFEFGLLGQILLGSMLFFIMFAVGASLELRDFHKSLKHPRAYVVGLLCQYGLMPLFALTLSYLFSLSPEVFFGHVNHWLLPWWYQLQYVHFFS